MASQSESEDSFDDSYHNAVCACPRMYDPYCGNDLHVYSNMCMFECAQRAARALGVNLQVRRRGSCFRGDADEAADDSD